MANIRKGDLVQVISGPTQDRGGDRGKQGRVIGIIAEKNRVIVEGVNYVTKHSKVGQTQRGTKTGGIETMEAPIHVSNIALVDPETKLPARVGFREETDDRGKTVRVRYFKKSRRVETKKSKALKGTASETADSEKAAKAEPKAKKAAAAAQPRRTLTNGNDHYCREGWRPGGHHPAAPQAEVPQRDLCATAQGLRVHQRAPGADDRQGRRQHRCR